MHVFLDLDGTLTDSSPGIINCLTQALRRVGADVPPEAQLRACVGPPLPTWSFALAGD
jgi:phosphoglycolate phosphatase